MAAVTNKTYHYDSLVDCDIEAAYMIGFSEEKKASERAKQAAWADGYDSGFQAGLLYMAQKIEKGEREKK